jgi:hypothetical protein
MSNRYGWTKGGVCRILEEEGNSVKIMLPGRKRAQIVSKTHVVEVPAELRLVKKADFDQDCGCTAVLDVNGAKVEAFNIYGSLKKFLTANPAKGLAVSPYHRRVFLEENGFVRALGQKRSVKDVGEVVFDYVKRGYRLLDESKAVKAENEKAAEKKEEAAVATA